MHGKSPDFLTLAASSDVLVIAQAKENTLVGRIGPARHPKPVGQTYCSRAQKGEFPGASRGRLRLETRVKAETIAGEMWCWEMGTS